MVRAVARLAARFRRKPKARMALRPAKPIDYGFARQTCFAALRALVEADYGWDEALEDGRFARQFVQDQVEILSFDGRDVGWLQSSPDRGALRLIGLCIVPGFRGRGLGRFALEQIQARAKKQRRSLLLSLSRIDPSLGFYRRLGFRLAAADPYQLHLRYRPKVFRRAFGPTPGMTRG